MSVEKIAKILTPVSIILALINPMHAFAEEVYAPYFENSVIYSQTAVFWFGKVNSTENYTDVRIGYDKTKLYIDLEIFDKYLWYDPNATPSNLTKGDYAIVYLDRSGNSASPVANTYKFIGQLNWWEARTNFQAAYQGNGSGWTPISVPFSTYSGWRGDAPNNAVEDRGWVLSFSIPFTSLGLSVPPANGEKWKLGIIVHDVDDSVFTPINDKSWPLSLNQTNISSWGDLFFGLEKYTPPPADNINTVTIKQGLDGDLVSDNEVGGGTVCGADSDYWTQWGEKNYNGFTYTNIQNQSDVSDWPCFSKFYLSFPLTKIPAGKVITSAGLTLYHFGHAGAGYTPGPQPAYIQLGSVDEPWSPLTINWNNAPPLGKNISYLWVDPLSSYPYPGVARTWDAGLAVSSAYKNNTPLQLVLYTPAGEYHSGRYFRTSDDIDINARPYLTVSYGNPQVTVAPSLSLCPLASDGDINCDGIVNLLDFTGLISRYGSNDNNADLNEDSIVNMLDLSILVHNFGKSS